MAHNTNQNAEEALPLTPPGHRGTGSLQGILLAATHDFLLCGMICHGHIFDVQARLGSGSHDLQTNNVGRAGGHHNNN